MAHDHSHDHQNGAGCGHDHDPKKEREHGDEGHGHDHAEHDHDHEGHDHAEHDHAEHKHAEHDHDGHDHEGHDHAGHDHSGCGHDHGHDHSGHDHSAKTPEKVALNASVAGNIETRLRVGGMDCADEVAAIEQVLRPLHGIREFRVNLMGGKVTLFHDETITPEALIAAIDSTGLKAVRDADKSSAAGQEADAELETAKRRRQLFVGFSGALTGIGLIMEWTKAVPWWAEDAVYLAAIIFGGWYVVPKGLRALRRLALDMNVLMTVAVLGALCIRQYSEAAAVTFLFSLSELLEAFSLARARKAVQALMSLTPETAFVKTETGYVETPVEQVQPGAIFRVKSGARVPLDGIVTGGESSVNQAPITGESMPVAKEKGDGVYGGTINGEGSLEVRATKAYADTTVSKIISLVEEAQSQKAPAQQFVDVFARYYTPAVMIVAILLAIFPPLLSFGSWHDWFYRGLVLLVIACPCALVISTPVSVVSGLTAMARRGVLIKGGAILEKVGRLTMLAVDKTGTITEGKPRVTRVVPVVETDEKKILAIAAAIDAHSEHPLAQAVVAYAVAQGVVVAESTGYQNRSGRGAEAVVDGHSYFVGNHRFTHELGVCSPAIEARLSEIEADAQSVVVVGHRPHDGCAGEVLGILAVGDTIRPNATAAIAALHRAGIKKVVMLSGDNQRTADAIAKKAGIDEAYGDLLPDQKIERVKALMRDGEKVGMVGDGVNDAPAMAAADIGIAMGGTGTDTAIETADMALMQDDLSRVAEAIKLGRRTLAIIQFNIIFALGLKAIFLVLAVLDYTSLWLAIAADTGATLLVIANALRLLKDAPADR